MNQQSDHLDTVMSRTKAVFVTALILCALMWLLAGCGTLFPNFTAAVAPQSTEMVGMALLADFQMWIETVGGLFAFLFGG